MTLTVVTRDETVKSLVDEHPGAKLYVLTIGPRYMVSALFEAVEATLPTDPPLGDGNKWDALSDSLFEGLLASGEQRVVIYWDDAGAFKREQPEAFEIALDVLRDVAESVSDPSIAAGHTVALDVVVHVDEPDS